MSPTSLAYIGDSVFELFARSRYVFPSRRTTDLQKIVVEKVRGEFVTISMVRIEGMTPQV
jgi:23S rRNA maturation mini-RNase III